MASLVLSSDMAEGENRLSTRQKLKRGLWSPEEDEKLVNYFTTYGRHGCWSSVPNLAGLPRCGKSCRLRWNNYLRPGLKRGSFSLQEATLIIELHNMLGNKWAQIASYLPGRTDSAVKNFWNSNTKKKLLQFQVQIVNDQERRVDQETENEVDLPTLPPSFMREYFDPILDQNWDPNHLIMQPRSENDSINLITNSQPNIQFIDHNFNSI